jgi:hypothetical protein
MAQSEDFLEAIALDGIPTRAYASHKAPGRRHREVLCEHSPAELSGPGTGRKQRQSPHRCDVD